MPEGVEFDEQYNNGIVTRQIERQPTMVSVFMKMGVIKNPATGYMVLVIITIACFVGSIAYFLIGNPPRDRVGPEDMPPHNRQAASSVQQ